MVYVFSPDGQSFAWLDAHGLTRVRPGARPKTDPRLAGGYDARVSRNASGSVILAVGGSGYPRETILYNFPDLTVSRVIDTSISRGARVLHPDGRRFLVGRRKAYLSSWGVARCTLDAQDVGFDRLATREEALPSRGIHVLGHANEASVMRALFDIHEDGTFLLMDRKRHCVIGGALPSADQPVEARWKATIPTSPNQQVRLYPQADWSLVVAFDPVNARNRVLAIPAEGEPVAFTVAGISVLQRAGDWLAVQVDEQTVIRLSLAAAIAGALEVESFTLEGTPWTIAGRALPRQDTGAFREALASPLWDVGLGDVLLHEQALWFVPWHREAFCNLLTGERQVRPLSDDETKNGARRFIMSQYTRFRSVGRKAGCYVRPGLLRFEGSSQFHLLWSGPANHPRLSGHLVEAWVRDMSGNEHMRDLHGWSYSSGGGSFHNLWSPTSPEDAAQAVRFAAAHGIPPRVALLALDRYDSSLRPNAPDPAVDPGPLSLGAHQVLLWMALEGFCNPDIDIVAALPAWQSTPITQGYITSRSQEIKASLRDTGQSGAFNRTLRHYFARQGQEQAADFELSPV